MVVATRKQNLNWRNPETDETLNWMTGNNLIYKYYDCTQEYKKDSKALRNRSIMFIDQIINKVYKVVLLHNVICRLTRGVPTGKTPRWYIKVTNKIRERGAK